jgi:hypothetical protein
MAMMAMTTSSSIKVKPKTQRGWRRICRLMDDSFIVSLFNTIDLTQNNFSNLKSVE